MLLEDHPASFLETQKGLFSETHSKSELQGGYRLGSPPPPTEDAKKTPG